MKKPESFIEKALEKASQNAVIVRSKYMNIIKRDIASSGRKEAVMNLKCGCDEYDMNVLLTYSSCLKAEDSGIGDGCLFSRS